MEVDDAIWRHMGDGGDSLDKVVHADFYNKFDDDFDDTDLK